MTNTDFIKRIQKRLSDKGIKISRNDLKVEISSLDFDLKALGEENVNTITKLLLDKHQNTELIVSEPEEIASVPSDEHNATTTNSTAITNQQKEQLITVQAQSLGIELSESEITDISQNVSDSFTDFVSAVETINSLIKDYAQSKFDSIEQQIRSEEHTSELQSQFRISYAVFCLKKKNSTYCSQHSQNIHHHSMFLSR